MNDNKNRRVTDKMTGNTESDILDAIQGAEDNTTRALLMIQLKTLRDLSSMIGGIGSRLDAFMSDEKRIAAMALNGHYEHHGTDHEWIYAQKLQTDAVNAEREWVQAKMAEEALARRQQEEADSDTRRQARATLWRLIERVSWAVLVAFALYYGVVVK